ncbi:RagB/SusD family nutrient uptake outer membrane protein [Pedobacter sp. PAMC26386]|nr:RagB/SusD family nutrient uptake outer membrane protein [Pedobacter sp. PAMC26386]
MKKIYYILLITATGLSACQKNYLTVEPETNQNGANYYKNKDQFIKAVNGAYAPLQALFNKSFWEMAEMRSDNTSYQLNNEDHSGILLQELDEFKEISMNDEVQEFLQSNYTGIGRCNIILSRLPKAKIDDPKAVDQIIGQASFLRAYYYFNLVRMFGNVPLVLAEVSSKDDAFKINQRKPVADIYASIITDATAAINTLTEVYTEDNSKGRATKGAARTLLADIYLTTKKYDLAIQQLRPLLTSVYQLNANYADNFDVKKKNGPESIFEIQYMEGPNGLHSVLADRFAPWDSPDGLITGFPINHDLFNGWNIPTRDFLEAYETGDLRRAVSVGENFISEQTGEMVPYVKKYNSPHAVREISGNNFPVYRYANVLLMLAECLNETGASGEALQYLNQVRNRAGLPTFNNTNQTDLRKAIIQERRMELAFENQRWFDLLRTGTAVEVMTLHAAREKQQKHYLSAGVYGNIRLLYLYPQREINLEQ